MQIKKTALLAGILAAAVSGSVAKADTANTAPVTTPYQGFQAGDILVRGRALAVIPYVDSSVSSIGGQVNASNSFEPEIDGTYFVTPNFGVEAIAAITRHHLTDDGSSLHNVDLGKISLLPPTILGQWHFLPQAAINPYVGAGLNYTFFFDSTLPTGGAVKSISYQNNVGGAVQAGFDYHLIGNWYANVDFKHLFLSTKAKINGGAIESNVSLDPTIVGLGIGYKF